MSCTNTTTTKKNIDPTTATKDVSQKFEWKAATVYFLLTDRFYNGDKENDLNFKRDQETDVLRGFEGGDIKGVTKKIQEGYFSDLGIHAIWLTPVVEQVHGVVDEGTGATYGYHGYWTKDWTALDPNFGTKKDLKEMVDAAHAKGIRVLLDAVINHTGPVTASDPIWTNWVRQGAICDFKNYEGNTSCDLVANLPDIITNSDQEVELPEHLVKKWKDEGRYEEEVAALDLFFKTSGLPKAPRFYIMKWLSDYITDFGIDGYRCDTVKHTEPDIWKEFSTICDAAFLQWKQENPTKVIDDTEFYLVGEVYHYNASNGIQYDYGDKKVDYSKYGFDALINFDLKNQKNGTYQTVFEKYDTFFQNEFKEFSLLNYMSSHDDMEPFDPKRINPYQTATKLLLCPGAAQIYYGDEVGRSLIIPETQGDATLRSIMDWEAITTNFEKQKLLTHWQKLGSFRHKHNAIGAGNHFHIQDTPYVFARTRTEQNYKDTVIIGLEFSKGQKKIPVNHFFEEGDTVIDTYSGTKAIVTNNEILLHTPFDIVLLEKE
ncbi:alpha-amylase family glycosyl hydrolase [Aquimarina addita]